MLDINKHKAVLVQILKDIYADTKIAPLLGFKGGTACYLFYDLPRFSVDLDFDLLDLEEKEVVFKKVGKILEEYGVLKEKREKRFTLFFLLSYEEGERNIKVEISKREDLISLGSYEIKNYLGISIPVMRKEDMFASKLVALTQREKRANRDLFDLWFFMKNKWGINEKIIKARAGKESADYLQECLAFVRNVDQTYILHGLGELMGEKKKEWVKKNLREDLLFFLNLYLEEVRESS